MCSSPLFFLLCLMGRSREGGFTLMAWRRMALRRIGRWGQIWIFQVGKNQHDLFMPYPLFHFSSLLVSPQTALCWWQTDKGPIVQGLITALPPNSPHLNPIEIDGLLCFSFIFPPLLFCSFVALDSLPFPIIPSSSTGSWCRFYDCCLIKGC